jgi:hypothetical protein
MDYACLAKPQLEFACDTDYPSATGMNERGGLSLSGERFRSPKRQAWALVVFDYFEGA